MNIKSEKLAQSSREHYRRMQKAGYKKYGIFLKTKTMNKIDELAIAINIPKYQLIDIILEQYIDNRSNKQSNDEQC